MNDYLSKPLHYQAMYATLARWTRRNVPQAAQAMAEIGQLGDASVVLDTEDAMARMGGEELYLNMLARFIPSQGQALQSIQEALDINDLQTAERLAHTLKGVAASVGAAPLAESANQLELAIRRKDAGSYPQLIEAAAGRLSQAVALIESYLKEQGSQP